MTAPVTGITPLYGLEYLVEGEPAYFTRQKLERNAKTIEAALAALAIPPADYAALVAAGWFSDTGWLNVTMRSGFAALAGADKPQARMRGGLVYLRGAFATTGMAVSTVQTVADLPVGITRPGANHNVYSASSTAVAGGKLVVQAGGGIQIGTPAALGGYYALNTSYCPGAVV